MLVELLSSTLAFEEPNLMLTSLALLEKPAE
jgi:hypothetical protein